MVQRRPGSVWHRGVSRRVLGMETIGSRLIPQLCQICAKSEARGPPLQRAGPGSVALRWIFRRPADPPRRLVSGALRYAIPTLGSGGMIPWREADRPSALLGRESRRKPSVGRARQSSTHTLAHHARWSGAPDNHPRCTPRRRVRRTATRAPVQRITAAADARPRDKSLAPRASGAPR